MATIEEHNAKMTIFYYKSNGDIYSYATGIQSMQMFGIHAEEYALIMDCLIVDRDPMVMESIHKFYIDTDAMKIKVKDEYNVNKYL